MVLKDAGGLVKLYALVNVEQYGIVATGETQAKAMQAYKELLVENCVIDNTVDLPGDENKYTQTVRGTISAIRTVIVDGNTLFYITLDSGRTYRASIERVGDGYKNEGLIFFKEGDFVAVTYYATNSAIQEITGIFYVDEVVE
jgi:hypothetical protein